MRRVLVLLLVVSAQVSLSAPRAAATSGLTLHVDRSVVLEGDPIHLSGWAPDAALGSKVALQRKSSSGWATVGWQIIRTHRFDFERTPRRGNPTFRAVTPRQPGTSYAVSPSRTVTVEYQPRIFAIASGELDTTHHEWVTEVFGSTLDAPGAAVQVQRWDGSSWVSTGESLAQDAQADFHYTIHNEPRGARYRFFLPRLGLARPAASQPITIEQQVTQPQLELTVEGVASPSTDGYVLEQHVTGHTSDPDQPLWLGVSAEYPSAPHDAGVFQEFRLVDPAADGTFDMTIGNVPDGAELWLRSYESSDHLILESASSVVLATVPHVTVEPDGAPVTIAGVAPGNGAYVDISATAGVPLSFDLTQVGPFGVGTIATLADPHGTSVWNWTTSSRSQLYGPDPVYVPKESGTYVLTLRSEADWQQQRGTVRLTISTPLQLAATWNTPLTIASTRPEQLVDIAFSGKAGQGFSIAGLGDCPEARLYRDGLDVIESVRPFISDAESLRGLWRLPYDGDYLLRLLPCNNTPLSQTITLTTASEGELVLGHADGAVDLSRQDSYGVIRFAATAGKFVDLTLVSSSGTSGYAGVISPGGHTFGGYPAGSLTFQAPEDGVYELWIGPGSGPGSTETWSGSSRNN